MEIIFQGRGSLMNTEGREGVFATLEFEPSPGGKTTARARSLSLATIVDDITHANPHGAFCKRKGTNDKKERERKREKREEG